MVTIEVAGWEELTQRFKQYMALPPVRRDQVVFRGQADASWGLSPTLDRLPSTGGARPRRDLVEALVREFELQCLGLAPGLGVPRTPRGWELLGRHHGLPTTILDWTVSPYIAAFFAFAELVPRADACAIYAFDRRYFERGDAAEDPIEVWDDPDDYRFNMRAIEQGAVFMKTHEKAIPLEANLYPFLWRYTLPTADRTRVLSELAEMRITHRQLFRDLDHAAKAAQWRVVESGASHDT